MRRRVLLGTAVALLALPATGHAQSGGATVPATTGGAGYGTSAPGLTASRFKVTPRTLTLGAPASFRYRIDGAQRSARVRIELLAAGARRPAATIRMGWKRTRRTLIRTWTPPAGVLAPGDYVARLHAVDRNGRTLRRTATASGRSRLTVIAPAPPPAITPTAPVARHRPLPHPRRLHLGRRVRRQARHRRPPRAGHPHRRGHADRHAPRGRRVVARLPGVGRRQLRRRPRRRRPRLRLHAPPERLDHRDQGRGPRAPARCSPRPA